MLFGFRGSTICGVKAIPALTLKDQWVDRADSYVRLAILGQGPSSVYSWVSIEDFGTWHGISWLFQLRGRKGFAIYWLIQVVTPHIIMYYKAGVVVLIKTNQTLLPLIWYWTVSNLYIIQPKTTVMTFQHKTIEKEHLLIRGTSPIEEQL